MPRELTDSALLHLLVTVPGVSGGLLRFVLCFFRSRVALSAENLFLRRQLAFYQERQVRDYWLGHAGNTMDDLYDKVKDNAAFRKQKAAQYSVGFELPASIVPNVPKERVKAKRAKAA